jgi:outer membrane receptor for ferrienterochelin and colicins
VTLLLLAFLLVVPPQASGAQAPAEITVTVRSAEGPVPGALVEVGRDRRRTDALGRLTIHVASPATLTVQADGFLPASIPLAAPLPAQLEVVLEEVPEMEEEVVADATRTATRLADQPLRVEVIDGEEIEEKALMTPGSIAMLLAETTGLRVQTTAPSLGAANVRINGLRGRYTQLLADGLPLYGSQGDSFSLLQVPPLDLSRVEIVKGAASALYGPTALGGVVNLVTRRPGSDHADLLVNLTSQHGVDAAAFLGRGPRSGLGFTLLGGFHRQQIQDLDDDGWSDVPAFTRGVARPRLFFDSGRGATMFVTGGLNVEERRGGTVSGGVAPDGRPFDQGLDTTRRDGGVVARFVTSGGRVVAVRGSLSHTAQDRFFGDAFDAGMRLVWFGEASLAGVRGKHSWVLGAAVQQDRYRNDSVPDVDFTFTTPGVFAQDDIRFNDDVSASVSARVDVHNEYGVLAHPRLSLLGRPGDSWILRASTGLGVFAPTPLTEETEEVGFSRLRMPISLKVERAWASSFDVTRLLGPVEVTATAFSSRVAHPLTSVDVGEDHFALISVDDPARVWGAEAIVRYRGDGFSVVGTYAWTRATELDPHHGGRRETPLTPRHAVTFTAIRESEQWGRIGVEGYFTGRQALEDDPFRTVSRPYALVGVLAERRFGRLRLFVNAENLGDVRQTKYAPLVRPSRRPDGRWTVDAWAPLDGLVVNGGVRLVLDTR